MFSDFFSVQGKHIINSMHNYIGIASSVVKMLDYHQTATIKPLSKVLNPKLLSC